MIQYDTLEYDMIIMIMCDIWYTCNNDMMIKDMISKLWYDVIRIWSNMIWYNMIWYLWYDTYDMIW